MQSEGSEYLEQKPRRAAFLSSLDQVAKIIGPGDSSNL
ncbi:unnamed protein product [Acidithrix sp. C25]|nr:unnamed protein product [Acidithrix sp. C25]